MHYGPKMERYNGTISQVSEVEPAVGRLTTLVPLDECARDPRCAQDDSQGFVILSAAKDLARTYG
jgi:hypothetical protein